MTTGLKLYLSSTASAWDLDSNPADLQGTFQLNEVQDGSSHEFTVTLDATLTTCAWYFATKGNVPSNAAWETGDWSIPINITDALARSEVTVGLKLVDIDSGGLGGPGVIETSLYAANQGANTTGVKTFTFSSEAWANSNDATDRLIIEVRFYKGLTDGVVGFTVGDANVVLTPLTRPHTVAPTAIIISGFVPSPSNSTVATVAPSAASCSGVAPAPGGSTAAVCLAAAALASALVPVPAVATAATVAPTPAIASAVAPSPAVSTAAAVSTTPAAAAATIPPGSVACASTVGAEPAVAGCTVPGPAVSAVATVVTTPAIAGAVVPSPSAATIATVLAAPAVADAVVAGPVIVLQGVSAGWWETLHGILRARFSSLVEGPEGVLVAYDDEAAADLEAATEWIRVAVVTNDGGQVELGVARHRRRGELVATIAVPAGQGDARAWELADAINAAFRGQQDQDVAFRPAPYPIARGLDGDRHELEVRVPFEREEVHAS